MEVLHSIWDTNNLHIWAENTSKLKKKISDDIALSKVDKTHPYTASFSRLLEILKTINDFSTSKINIIEPNWLVMKLPTKQNFPVLSVENLNDQNSNVKFSHWQINTLNLHPTDAFEFLLSIPNTPPDGLMYSNSLGFWVDVAKFCLELVMKNSYIPSIKLYGQDSSRTIFTGNWEAIIQDNDFKLFNMLVNSIPAYCNSLFGKEYSSDKIVLSFINQIINSFIRRKLSVFIPSQDFSDSERSNELIQAWFKSLFDPEEPVIECINQDFAYFYGLIQAWQKKQFFEQQKDHFRTCFKLVPPNLDKGEDRWQINFYLQNKEDISIIVPAEDIWKSKTGTISYLQERFEDPRVKLLKDLGEASKHYPKISDCLETTFPSNIDLSNSEALEFLVNYSSQLEENGFGVVLPAWWKNPNSLIGLTLEDDNQELTSPTPYGFFRFSNLIDFNWQFSINDMKLTAEEFEKLSTLKVPFVQFRGKWLKLDQEELEKALDFFREYYNNLTINELLQLEAEEFVSRTTDFDLEIKGSFIDNIKRVIERSRIENIDTPVNFRGLLRPYQKKGYSWLLYLKQFGLGACLADDMGLGKTIQVIAYLLHEWNNNPDATPTIIICPTSILGNWLREIQRFAPSLSTIIHHGPKRRQNNEFTDNTLNYDIIITTYSLALRDFDFLSQIQWSNIVVDEAQNIKNPFAKQTRKIKKLKGDYRIALTGTPIENRLSELWSIMDFLNPGYLGSPKNFRENYINPIENNRNTQSVNELARIIQPLILRRLKTDPTIIEDLPEKVESKIYCSMTEEQCVLYEAVVKDMMKRVSGLQGIHRKGLILSALTKLKQICNHPAQFMHDANAQLKDRSGKLNRLTEMLTEVIENNEKTLIFTQYSQLGEMLQKYLEKELKTEVLFLHGGTPQKQREEMIKQFQDTVADEGPKIFILSIKAGGVGLNLTAANHVFHFDRWWNPSVENQATDRAFRIGQEKNVFVHKFISVGTLEENIDKLIEQKKELAESIIGTDESWLTEMSIDQLRNVLSLRKITLGES